VRLETPLTQVDQALNMGHNLKLLVYFSSQPVPDLDTLFAFAACSLVFFGFLVS